MGLLTIGAFARASRLSPKALRIYDDLGLLRPARVDPASGYRLYHPDQLERARLVAWLRRLGMPLARIRLVCSLDPPEAAREVAAYWRQVEAETGARRQLAAFLVDHLSGKDAVMPDEPAVRDAGTAVREFAAADPSLHEVGTTLTAMLWSGSQLALVHVGDSRAYLLRDGELYQITHDHTVVQSLVDEGRLTAEEAASHPQRSILIRALHAGTAAEPAGPGAEPAGPGAEPAGPGAEPDLQLRDARIGDRYLLCSDGLHTVVPTAMLRDVLSAVPDPDQAVRRLVELANHGGGPDNIACVVADVVEPA
jgi:protein phosphatase